MTLTRRAPIGDHFDTRAADWLDRYRRKASFQSRLATVQRVLDEELSTSSPKAVLDFGSGPGLFGAMAAAYAPFVVCLDTSFEMVAAGASPAGRQQVTRLLGDATAGKSGTSLFVAGSTECLAPHIQFDVVLAIAVLEYLPHLVSVFGRLADVAPRGGLLVCTVPRPRSTFRRLERTAGVAGPALRRVRHVRAADREYLDMRPHGDALPWETAAATAGWALRRRVRVPLGRRGAAAHLAPNEVVVFDRLGDPGDGRGDVEAVSVAAQSPSPLAGRALFR